MDDDHREVANEDSKYGYNNAQEDGPAEPAYKDVGKDIEQFLGGRRGLGRTDSDILAELRALIAASA